MANRWQCEPPFDKARQSHYRQFRRRLRICRWCGATLPGGRTSWCSDKCANEYMIRTSGSWLRAAVFKRDRGICADCGIDTQKLRRLATRILWNYHWDYVRRRYYRDHDSGKKYTGRRAKWLFRRWPWIEERERNAMTYWEAAHIVALSEGGHNGLSNYKTLCVGCHRADTKQLAARLARERKLESTGQLELLIE